MKTYSNIDSQDLTRQLVIAGFLPVYAQDAAITHPAPHGLFISQEGGLLENSVFDLDCGGGTGCILDLHIAVELPAIKIWHWELDFPWKDPKFQFLHEPQGSKFPDNMYKMPCRGNLMYSRDVVINHRRLLKHCHGFEGLLLGYSPESIPDSCPNGKEITATLVLVDEMGCSFSERVQLYVDRSAKIDRQRGKKKIRRSLLDQLVYNGEDVLKDGEEVLIETGIS